MKFSEPRIHAILAGLQQGNTRRASAEAAGVSSRTLQRWLQRGRDSKTGKYVELLRRVEAAECKAETAMVKSIVQAASEGDWRAAAWWLERRVPQDFAKRQRLSVEPEQGPVEFVVQIGGTKHHDTTTKPPD